MEAQTVPASNGWLSWSAEFKQKCVQSEARPLSNQDQTLSLESADDSTEEQAWGAFSRKAARTLFCCQLWYVMLLQANQIMVRSNKETESEEQWEKHE